MKRITQKKIYGKQKNEEVVRQVIKGDLNTRMELIQRLIPLGLLHVQEQLQREVEELCRELGTVEVMGQSGMYAGAGRVDMFI